MDNIQKAFRNLQELHKRWKDELGPIAKEHGETLWERFSEATKVIHEKRQFFQKNQTDIYKANYEKKKQSSNKWSNLLKLRSKPTMRCKR
jgi:hypothetical protein